MFASLIVGSLLLSTAHANPLQDQVGRSETRVWSAPYAPAMGRSVSMQALPERLSYLDYRKVAGTPEHPGEYRQGADTLEIYRRAHRVAGVD